MKKAYLDICRLLVSSGYSEREVKEFIFELFNLGPNVVIEDIDNIRNDLKKASHSNSIDYPNNYRVQLPKNTNKNLVNNTAKKIEQLLVYDAGLSKSEAAELLAEELHKKFPQLEIPALSKKSFYIWIDKLISIAQEKELLHIATIIRNRLINNFTTDWRLR